MKQDNIPAPVDQRIEFSWESTIEEWPLEANTFPLAGSTNNAPFAQQMTSIYDILDEDPDLADLDGVDYDAVVVKDARIVHVTEVRLEGNVLVPVKKNVENAEAAPSRLSDGQLQLENSSTSGSSS